MVSLQTWLLYEYQASNEQYVINKDADQSCSISSADQRLGFSLLGITPPLPIKSEISSF